MSHHNKMKIHNARQTIFRLQYEAQQLQDKINLHLNANGLHIDKFQRAEHHLTYAIAKLKDAEGSLL